MLCVLHQRLYLLSGLTESCPALHTHSCAGAVAQRASGRSGPALVCQDNHDEDEDDELLGMLGETMDNDRGGDEDELDDMLRMQV